MRNHDHARFLERKNIPDEPRLACRRRRETGRRRNRDKRPFDWRRRRNDDSRNVHELAPGMGRPQHGRDCEFSRPACHREPSHFQGTRHSVRATFFDAKSPVRVAGKPRSGLPKPRSARQRPFRLDFWSFLDRSGRIHVAFMSRGAAVIKWNSFVINGNHMQQMRHGRG
jgi:hypothetical protein